jgi:carbon monoxide dehydrogenase subunit G
MSRFEGDKVFPLPVGDVAAKLSDAAWLVSCLPDVKVTESTRDRAGWRLKPKLSFVTGSLDAIIEAVERDPGKMAAYRITTKGIGASSSVLTRLEFRDAGGVTSVHWTGELVEVTGLLKMVPRGLIQATAQKVIEDVWEAVSARLGQPLERHPG